MSQLQMDLGPAPPPRGAGWDRTPGVYSNCGAQYDLLMDGKPTGYYVRHCGHPTAIRPYYVQTAEGELVERKFRLLDEAKGVCLSKYREAHP